MLTVSAYTTKSERHKVIIELAIGLAIGYGLGSIPFGLLFSAASGLGDIRQIGSGNIGATNVLRTGRKSVALATLLADALKAALPILLLTAHGLHQAAYASAVGAFLGHVFPVWLKFKGGKGIAVYLGASFALSPIAGGVFVFSWLASAGIWRISSLSALVACIATPLSLIMIGLTPLALVFALMSLLAIWTHRGNIQRIRAGTEPKIGEKAD